MADKTIDALPEVTLLNSDDLFLVQQNNVAKKVPRSVLKNEGTNILDNWYFVGGGSQQGGGQFPINRRGLTSLSSTGYFVDRWKRTTGTGGATAITLDARGLYCTGTSNLFMRQGVTNRSSFDGKVLTWSVLYENAGLSSVTHILDSDGRFACSASLKAGYARDRAFAVPNEIAGVYASPNDRLIAVKLELGNQQTLAHLENGAWIINDIPNYDDMLFRCMTSTADSTDTYANTILFSNKGIEGSVNTGDKDIWIQCPDYNTGTVYTSNTYTSGFIIRDANNDLPLSLRGFATPNGNGLTLQARRIVNGTSRYNSIRLLIDTEGAPVVQLIGLNADAVWRKALGLCYAVNDTFQTVGSTSFVMNGLITNGCEDLFFDLYTDKSMENVSSFTLTRMTGSLRTKIGTVPDINYAGGDFSFDGTKITDHHLKLHLSGNSAICDTSANNGPVAFYGTLTIKFT